MEGDRWLLCPICNGKTRTRIRQDSTLMNFPLFCPKCKNENLINVQKMKITVIEEPDAMAPSQQTQSRSM